MSQSEIKIGAGNVDIMLKGQPHTLVASYKAALRLSQLAGGLQDVQARIMSLDLPTIAQVIAAGADLEYDEALIEVVYETGLYDLWIPAGAFVANMANGGRPPVLPTAEDKKKRKGENGSRLNA